MIPAEAVVNNNVSITQQYTEAGIGYLLGTSKLTRSILVQVGVTLSWSGLSQGKPLSHQVVERWAISALNGLRWEVELQEEAVRRTKASSTKQAARIVRGNEATLGNDS